MNSIFVILLSTVMLSDASSNSEFSSMLGGRPVKIQKRPYHIKILVRGSYNCGGCILNQNTILTAGHCVIGYRPEDLAVYVGSDNIRGGKRHNVSKYFIHSGYKLFPVDRVRMARNDVGVVKLKTKIKFNKKARPIKLQPRYVPVPAGTMAIITGWGSLKEEFFPSFPKKLQELETTVITNKECNKRYSKIKSKFKVRDDLICTLDPGKGICYGDSGGPLVVGNRVIGIASSSITCGDSYYPSTYANVSHLHDYIAKYM